MKYVYVVSYDDTTNNPAIHVQKKQLNDYFSTVGIEKIVCGYDEFSLNLLKETASRFNIPTSIQIEYHTLSLSSAFEQELLYSTSPVVFIMHKEHAQHLLSYIDRHFSELHTLPAKDLTLFRIVIESDRIGIEQIWRPLLNILL